MGIDSPPVASTSADAVKEPPLVVRRKLSARGHVGDGVSDPDIDAPLRTFSEQHGHDGAGRSVAEQLAERLLVVGDAMALDQRDEIILGVAGERRPAEVRIAGEKPVGRAMQVGEIAAPAARDQNLGADLVGMVEEEDPAAALAGRQRAHQPGRARPEHNDIERLGRFRHWAVIGPVT